MFTLEPGEFVHINKAAPAACESLTARPFLTRVPILFCSYSTEGGGSEVEIQWGCSQNNPSGDGCTRIPLTLKLYSAAVSPENYSGFVTSDFKNDGLLRVIYSEIPSRHANCST